MRFWVSSSEVTLELFYEDEIVKQCPLIGHIIVLYVWKLLSQCKKKQRLINGRIYNLSRVTRVFGHQCLHFFFIFLSFLFLFYLEKMRFRKVSLFTNTFRDFIKGSGLNKDGVKMNEEDFPTYFPQLQVSDNCAVGYGYHLEQELLVITDDWGRQIY